MHRFINKQQTFNIEDYLDSYLTKKPSDCTLYSQDGSKFNVHKEIFGQTSFLREILYSVEEQCCRTVEVLCPCTEFELEHLVNISTMNIYLFS